MTFDPSQFGATPLTQSSFDPSKFGAVAVTPTVAPVTPPTQQTPSIPSEIAGNYTSQLQQAQSELSQSGTQIQNSVNPMASSGGILDRAKNLGEGLLGAGAGAANAIFAPITAPVTALLHHVSLANEANPSPTAPLVDSPEMKQARQSISDWAQAHPELAKTLTDAFTIGGSVVGGETNLAKASIEDVAKGAQETITKVGDELAKPAPPPAFNQNYFNETLNKALPVLKKDVNSLPVKQADAKTALTDIVQNKEKSGIIDTNGEAKSPSKYTFEETAQAQNQRLKDVYKEYTAKLSDADKMKFTSNLKTDVSAVVKKLQAQAETTLNQSSKKAIVDKVKELKNILSKPYIDPLSVQTYIEDLGKEAKVGGGQAPTFKNIQAANIGGVLRGVLDGSIEKVGGKGYQDLRNVYKAHKTIQSQLLQGAKSELNKTPGWIDRMANLGMTGEGINFLLTHDPHSLAIGAAIKGSTMFTKYIRSPQRALSNLFKHIEETQKPPLTPSDIK